MASHMGKLLRLKSLHNQQLLLNCQAIARSSPSPTVVPCTSVTCTMQVRYVTTKHYNPKFRILRRKKFLEFELPDFGKMQKESALTPEEMRDKMKKDKFSPPRVFQERPINISASGAVFEEYVPPEGDGKSSFISKEGVKQKYAEFSKKGKSYLDIRKIRQYEDDFDIKEFARTAQDIAIEAQKCLENVQENEDRLHDLVTEKAFPEMVFGLINKTLHWKFVESIEAPRVVHVRATDMLGKGNLYAQVTVRMHTKQILAIYDRFGRLMYGSESIAKDCLEYVVFEKHVVNIYGQWRVHAKIIPTWMPAREPLLKTYRQPELEPLPETDEKKDVTTTNEGKGAKVVASKDSLSLAT